LFQDWYDASQAYWKVVNAFGERLGEGNVSRDEYVWLKKQCASARVHTTESRKAFDLHVKEHGCSEASAPVIPEIQRAPTVE